MLLTRQPREWKTSCQRQLLTTYEYGPLILRILTRLTCVQRIRELQNKAHYFEQSGLISTLDACAAVIKSDVFISDELHRAVRHAFKRLPDDQGGNPIGILAVAIWYDIWYIPQ